MDSENHSSVSSLDRGRHLAQFLKLKYNLRRTEALHRETAFTIIS